MDSGSACGGVSLVAERRLDQFEYDLVGVPEITGVPALIDTRSDGIWRREEMNAIRLELGVAGVNVRHRQSEMGLARIADVGLLSFAFWMDIFDQFQVVS